MTLQSSGPISMSQICAEFGAPSTTPLSGLYRGGAYVPNIAANATIPTSGAISLSNFYGTTATTPPAVTLTGATISDSDVLGTLSSSAQLSVLGNGTVTANLLNDGVGAFQLSPSTDWIIPNGSAPDDYEVRATVNSGAVSSGTTGTWLPLTSDRSWIVSCAGSGSSAAANLTIEIRKGAGAALASAVYVLTADVP